MESEAEDAIEAASGEESTGEIYEMVLEIPSSPLDGPPDDLYSEDDVDADADADAVRRAEVHLGKSIPTREVVAGHPLASSWAKYNRAVEHQLELLSLCLDYMKRSAGAGAIEQRRLDPLTIEFFAKLPPMDPRIPCVIGDVVHALRTALEHAAWALATKKDDSVQFPICDSPESFAKKAREKLNARHPTDVVALFESLQPYHGRAGLKWLRDLNNVDKHEAIVVACHRLEVRSLVIRDAKTNAVVIDLSQQTRQPGPIDVSADGPVIRIHQRVPGTPRLALQVAFENSVALEKSRSWPQQRLDRVFAKINPNVVDTLEDIQRFIGATRT